jgi:hypothetical protein
VNLILKRLKGVGEEVVIEGKSRNRRVKRIRKGRVS